MLHYIRNRESCVEQEAEASNRRSPARRDTHADYLLNDRGLSCDSRMTNDNRAVVCVSMFGRAQLTRCRRDFRVS
jgi:hypothetical protein